MFRTEEQAEEPEEEPDIVMNSPKPEETEPLETELAASQS